LNHQKLVALNILFDGSQCWMKRHLRWSSYRKLQWKTGGYFYQIALPKWSLGRWVHFSVEWFSSKFQFLRNQLSWFQFHLHKIVENFLNFVELGLPAGFIHKWLHNLAWSCKQQASSQQSHLPMVKIFQGLKTFFQGFAFFRKKPVHFWWSP